VTSRVPRMAACTAPTITWDMAVSMTSIKPVKSPKSVLVLAVAVSIIFAITAPAQAEDVGALSPPVSLAGRPLASSLVPQVSVARRRHHRRRRDPIMRRPLRRDRIFMGRAAGVSRDKFGTATAPSCALFGSVTDARKISGASSSHAGSPRPASMPCGGDCYRRPPGRSMPAKRLAPASQLTYTRGCGTRPYSA
jgi:hypothetical protein